MYYFGERKKENKSLELLPSSAAVSGERGVNVIPWFV